MLMWKLKFYEISPFWGEKSSSAKFAALKYVWVDCTTHLLPSLYPSTYLPINLSLYQLFHSLNGILELSDWTKSVYSIQQTLPLVCKFFTIFLQKLMKGRKNLFHSFENVETCDEFCLNGRDPNENSLKKDPPNENIAKVWQSRGS